VAWAGEILPALAPRGLSILLSKSYREKSTQYLSFGFLIPYLVLNNRLPPCFSKHCTTLKIRVSAVQFRPSAPTNSGVSCKT